DCRGLGFTDRAAAVGCEVARVRYGLALQNAVDCGDQGNEVVDRLIALPCCQPCIVAQQLELVEDRVLAFLLPVIEEPSLEQAGECGIRLDALAIVQLSEELDIERPPSGIGDRWPSFRSCCSSRQCDGTRKACRTARPAGSPACASPTWPGHWRYYTATSRGAGPSTSSAARLACRARRWPIISFACSACRRCTILSIGGCKLRPKSFALRTHPWHRLQSLSVTNPRRRSLAPSKKHSA